MLKLLLLAKHDVKKIIIIILTLLLIAVKLFLHAMQALTSSSGTQP